MRARLVALSAAVLGLSAGCGWFFFPTSLGSLVESRVRAECHFYYACCTAPERSLAGGVSYKDESTCVTERLEEADAANSLVARAQAALDAGNGEYDQERADECLRPVLDALNSCDADAVFNNTAVDDPSCAADYARGFVKGSIKDGDDCNDDIECADYGACVREPDEDTISTEGECQGAAGKGDSCYDADAGEAIPCQAGLTCEFDGTDAYTCEEQEKLDDGEECYSNDECDSGACVDGQAGECWETGEPCTGDGDCTEVGGDFCDTYDTSVCGDPPKVEICDGV
jgi:hypothetical protein